MSAGDPNTEAPTEQIANSASGKATSADSANTSAPEESGVEKKKKKGIIGKALDFMPAWAWILSFGLIMAIIAAIIAVTAMNSTEVGKGGANSKPSQVTPNYPEATTSGTWTQSRPANPQPYYDPGYQPDYNYAPETPTSEESATENSSKPSSEPRPSEAPRPRPSTRPQPEQPQPAPPNNGSSPNPPGGNGGNGGNGNTPGGDGGNGGASGASGGNGGNGGGEAPLNPPSAPGN